MSVLVLVSSSRFSFRFFTGVFSRKVHFRSIDWHRSIDRSIDRNFALVSNNEERDEGRRSIPRVSPRGVARENSRIGGIRIGESGSVFFFFLKNTEIRGGKRGPYCIQLGIVVNVTGFK